MNEEENDWKLESGTDDDGIGSPTGGRWPEFDPNYVPRKKTLWERAKSTAVYQLYDRISDTIVFFKNWPDNY